MALIIPLAAALLLTAGTIVHDRRHAGREPEKMHFWFCSDQELCDLWKLVGGTERFSHDAENVWEWIGSKLHEGSRDYHVSICRKHGDYSDPVHIAVTYQEATWTPEMRDQLGRRIATALKTEIKSGSVEYLGGNDFAFTEEVTFASCSANRSRSSRGGGAPQ